MSAVIAKQHSLALALVKMSQGFIQVQSRIQIILIQKLDCPLARASSHTHNHQLAGHQNQGEANYSAEPVGGTGEERA